MSLYHKLWYAWHCDLRQFFDRFAPLCSTCSHTLETYKELATEGYAPAISALKIGIHCHHAKYICDSRPWWHLCCNGDNGGWRTRLCDYLEYRWRKYT